MLKLGFYGRLIPEGKGKTVSIARRILGRRGGLGGDERKEAMTTTRTFIEPLRSLGKWHISY